MERMLPENLDAERAVIGSLVLDRDVIVAVAPMLTPDDFTREQHQWIFAAALELYGKNIPCDLITIGEILRQHSRLAEVGDIPGLAMYADSVPTAMHCQYYAQIVADTALSRAMIQAGGNIAAVGYESDLDRAALIHKAQQLLERATQRAKTSELTFGDQVSVEWNTAAAAGRTRAHSTGLVTLDQALAGGLHRGELILLAARTSVGKTSLALQIARRFLDREQQVLFVSLEMDRASLWDRLVSSEARLTIEQVRNRDSLSDAQMVQLAEADGKLAFIGAKLAIDDRRSSTITDIRNRALALHAERGPIGLVVVDYVQLVASPAGRGERNRVLEIGDISRGLRQLGGELTCPVLGLAQLSRGIEQRQDKVPLLSDLRESGNLEQDSDVVLFLDREEIYKPNTLKPGVVDVHIAKHRQGALGKVPLYFKKEYGRWSDTTYQTPQGY